MPEISRFYGISVSIRYREHPQPHFHAEYTGQMASFRLDSLSMIEGWLPPRVRGLVVEWASQHIEELQDDWNRAMLRQPLQSIKPLE